MDNPWASHTDTSNAYAADVRKVLDLKGLDALKDSKLFAGCVRDTAGTSWSAEHRMAERALDDAMLKQFHDAAVKDASAVDSASKSVCEKLQRNSGLPEPAAKAIAFGIARALKGYLFGEEMPGEKAPVAEPPRKTVTSSDKNASENMHSGSSEEEICCFLDDEDDEEIGFIVDRRGKKTAFFYDGSSNQKRLLATNGYPVNPIRTSGVVIGYSIERSGQEIKYLFENAPKARSGVRSASAAGSSKPPVPSSSSAWHAARSPKAPARSPKAPARSPKAQVSSASSARPPVSNAPASSAKGSKKPNSAWPLFVILILVFLSPLFIHFALDYVNSANASNASTYKSSSSVSGKNASQKVKDTYVGSWDLVESTHSNGNVIDAKQNNELRSKGCDNFLNISDDGSVALSFMGIRAYGSWAEAGNNGITLDIDGADVSDLKYDGKALKFKLTETKMTFEKGAHRDTPSRKKYSEWIKPFLGTWNSVSYEVNGQSSEIPSDAGTIRLTFDTYSASWSSDDQDIEVGWIADGKNSAVIYWADPATVEINDDGLLVVSYPGYSISFSKE